MPSLVVLFAALQLASLPCNPSLADQARRAFDQKNYQAAADGFRLALDSCPQQPALGVELARALLMARRFEEAEKAAREAVAANPRMVPAWLVLANTLYLIGKENQAERAFLRAIDLDPTNEDVLYSLGRVYYQQNRFELAVAQLQRVLALNPMSYKAWDNLGLCYEALGREDDAIRHFLKALDLVYQDHRGYDWPYANLANLLLKRGENEKAFQLASEAAVRNPASARNFFLTGKALSRLEKLDLAVKWLKQSIELDPAYPDPRYLLGQVFMKQGLQEAAQREFAAFEQVRVKAPRRRR